MAYATEDDLKQRLGSELVTLLADEDGDGAGDVSILAAALDDASAEIDAALEGRYVTPVSPTPQYLVRLTVDLATYFLLLRSRRAISPEYAENAENARRVLDALAEGETELDSATTNLRRHKSENTTREEGKHFDRDSLKPF